MNLALEHLLAPQSTHKHSLVAVAMSACMHWDTQEYDAMVPLVLFCTHLVLNNAHWGSWVLKRLIQKWTKNVKF